MWGKAALPWPFISDKFKMEIVFGLSYQATMPACRSSLQNTGDLITRRSEIHARQHMCVYWAGRKLFLRVGDCVALLIVCKPVVRWLGKRRQSGVYT